VSFGLLRAGKRIPLWAFHLVPALGTVLITALLHFRHDSDQTYAFFYIWVGLWAFYFLTVWAAALQVGIIGVLYGAQLALGQMVSAPVEHWLVSVGTVAVSGGFVARLAAELRQRAEQMSLLLDAARELAGAGNAASARPVVCDALLRFSGGLSTALYEPNADGSALVLTASAGAPIPAKPLPFVGSRSIAVRAFSSAQPVFVGQVDQSTEIDRDLQRATHLASGLWEPVLRHGEPVAVLVVFWGAAMRQPPRRVAELSAMLAVEAATTLDRAELMDRLEAVARTDDLTGLLNRRAWDEELPRELERARRTKQPFCVAMLDLDRFKDYNDEHGHQAGDRLLKRYAAAWSARLRKIDVLARYGGEEFAVILTGCDLPAATQLVEDLRAVSPDGQTCSVGVALWDGEETADALVSRADRALYEAKRSGRDRVVAAS
jgi:diguanylate cyclase (GGDEF)-like protein